MSQTKAQLLDNIKDNVQIDAQKALRFADSDSSHYVAFKAPATVSSSVTWTLPSADGSANYVLATDGSGNLSWIADPAGQWVTSGSNIYFTGGNVGIGDSSPSNPLSVTGASAFNGDVQFTGASYNVTWDKSADDLIFNDNAKAVFGTGSDLSIYHDSNDSYIHDGGSGNLNILTTGLRVRNAASSELMIVANEDGEVQLYFNNSEKLNTVTDGINLTGSLQFADDTNTYLAHPAADVLAITTAGSERLRVDASGKVGIGTSSPDRTLNISSVTGGNCDVELKAANNTGWCQLIFSDTDAAFRGGIGYEHQNNFMAFYTSASNERFRIDSSGRLLIGTATDQHGGGDLLQVAAASSAGSLSLSRYTANAHPSYINFFKSRNASLSGQTVVQSGDTLGLLAFWGSDGTDRALGAEICAQVDATPGSDDMPSRLVFRTSADGSQSPTERLRIDNGGRLLLGVTKTYGSASYYDDITINNSGGGSGAAGGVGINMIANAASWCGLLFGDPDDNSEGYVKYDNNTDAIKIGAGSSDRLLVNSEGMAFAADGSPATSGYGIRIKKSHASGGNVAQFFNENADNYGGLIVHGGGNDRECRLISAYGSSFMTFYTESAGGAHNEWMRIKSDGHVNFHTSGNSPSASQRGAQFEVNGTNTILQISAGAVSSGNHIEFYNTNGQVGRIYSNNSATTYSTSSDYRLKENTVAISDGITRVKALKPYRFNWKSDSSKTKIDGFFAHEVSPVVPEAIGGVKDAVEPKDNEDKKIKKGDIIPQSIDQSKLVPLLTAALQEAITKIEVLETKVAALESA